MTGSNVIRDLFLLSCRKIRSIYPVSPQQFYLSKRTYTGSQAVKEIPAMLQGRRCILTAPVISASCRGADCTQRGGGSPLETCQFLNREKHTVDRFYWICPLTVSRDNKNQKKSQSADAHLSSVINNLCHTGRYAVSIRYLPKSFTHSKEHNI